MGFFDLTASLPDGSRQNFSDYAGKVVLVVNTASQCGFTPQYQQLEQLYRDYQHRGFQLLAFPCNQFGGQEPGDAQEIADFCSLTYDISFPLMAKIEVNGPNMDPVFKYLKAQQKGLFGSAIKWNFTKFLVDRKGQVVSRHAPTTKPDALRNEIEALLG
ncbi:MAG TPA: glutathione peroxidase [Sphingopyxis sp.]|nr:glutathione peroxidase [Sphingopyxis sp.]